MRSRPIRAVTFDFWNTLFVEVAPQILEKRAELVRTHLADIGLHATKAAAKGALHEAWLAHRARWREGYHYKNTDAAELLLQVLHLPKKETVETALIGAIEYMYPANELTPCDNIHALLQKLTNANLGIGIICDTGFTPGHVLLERLEHLDLRRYFTGASFSDDVHACKPSPLIFEHSLGYLGTSPCETVHVGDLWRNDVAGASSAGFRTIRYAAWNDDEPGRPDAEFVAHSYDDIANWIASHQ